MCQRSPHITSQRCCELSVYFIRTRCKPSNAASKPLNLEDGKHPVYSRSLRDCTSLLRIFSTSKHRSESILRHCRIVCRSTNTNPISSSTNAVRLYGLPDMVPGRPSIDPGPAVLSNGGWRSGIERFARPLLITIYRAPSHHDGTRKYPQQRSSPVRRLRAPGRDEVTRRKELRADPRPWSAEYRRVITQPGVIRVTYRCDCITRAALQPQLATRPLTETMCLLCGNSR